MDPIRLFSIISWILLPTVMLGGYFLLHLQVRNNVLTPFKETYFRAGHAHAGTLLLLSLLYYQYLGQHTTTFLFQWIACIVALVGLLSIGGGLLLSIWCKERPVPVLPVCWSRTVGLHCSRWRSCSWCISS